MMIHQLLSDKKLFNYLENNEICDKKSNTSKEFFTENTKKINDEPIKLTKSLEFDDSEPNNLTLSTEPESQEPMKAAPLIEKDATRNNWWDNKICF